MALKIYPFHAPDKGICRVSLNVRFRQSRNRDPRIGAFHGCFDGIERLCRAALDAQFTVPLGDQPADTRNRPVQFEVYWRRRTPLKTPPLC